MGWIIRVRVDTMQGLFILAAAIAAVSADVHAPAHGYGYAPEFYCRDTNTSVYAEVCVPAFTDKVTPVELAVKVVEDEDYCFDRVLTVCEETEVVVDREICTYEYEGVTVTPPCTTTQVTYEQKSETMKVTACGAAGYGYGHQSYGGEHQVCKEEYQTQAYKVPLVTAPLELTCSLSYPAPKQVCVPRPSPSPRSSARTRLSRDASMWPSSLTAPTPSSRSRLSSESPAVTRSPSPFPPRPAARPTTPPPPTTDKDFIHLPPKSRPLQAASWSGYLVPFMIIYLFIEKKM